MGAAVGAGEANSEARIQIFGPMWVKAMHDTEAVEKMAEEAATREWHDAAELLTQMAAEAKAEAGGALLYYHLGEVQRRLAARGLALPSLAELIGVLQGAGHTACKSHSERKAGKTSATLDELVALVRAAAETGA